MTDRHAFRDVPSQLQCIAAGKPDGIILRAKEMNDGAYQQLAQEAISICRHHQVPLLLHQHPDVMPDWGGVRRRHGRTGVSVHSIEEARQAVRRSADFLIAGHIFPTACKQGLAPRGIRFLEQICQSVGVDVYAIGGINETTVRELAQVRAANFRGVCLMSGLMQARNPAQRIRRIRQEYRREKIRQSLRLYAVTDRQWLCRRPLTEVVEQALQGGVTMVQLREKSLDRDAFLEEARRIRSLCHHYQVPLIINDHTDIAKAIDADGVHLGPDDMSPVEARHILGKEKIIGVTARTLEQALAAEAAGADYLGCGAVFGTTTKQDATTMEKSMLCRITQSVTLPVAAIGGIRSDNLPLLFGTGIDGAAIVSGIFAAPEIRSACRSLRGIIDRICEPVTLPAVLSIAGSDPSGGAGIQADLKTMCSLGVYGMSCITAMTAQNTCHVTDIQESAPAFLEAQLDDVFSDISPDAVKTGMLASAPLVEVTAKKLRQYQAKNIVVDPVMISTSGSRLLSEEAVSMMQETLLPLADLITPNLPEAETLSGISITTAEAMEQAALILSARYHCAVLCKGGHRIRDASDALASQGHIRWYETPRVQHFNTHGTGCTLSSAIAAFLARGESLSDSIIHAKKYLTESLAAGLNLGRGSGPLAHNYIMFQGENYHE